MKKERFGIHLTLHVFGFTKEHTKELKKRIRKDIKKRVERVLIAWADDTGEDYNEEA